MPHTDTRLLRAGGRGPRALSGNIVRRMSKSLLRHSSACPACDAHGRWTVYRRSPKGQRTGFSRGQGRRSPVLKPNLVDSSLQPRSRRVSPQPSRVRPQGQVRGRRVDVEGRHDPPRTFSFSRRSSPRPSSLVRSLAFRCFFVVTIFSIALASFLNPCTP